MFCPYPTTCEWGAYRKTGVHFCNIGKCQYGMTAKAMLESEIGKLEQVRHKTQGQKEAIKRLREKYCEEFGGDAMKKNRGGGHGPPD